MSQSPSGATLHHLGRLAMFFAVFGLFIAAWSVVGDTYAGWYRDGAAWLFNQPEGQRFVKLEPVDDPTGHFQDTRVLVANRGHLQRPRVPVASFELSTRYTGYFDLTFLMTLILLTPMSWRRRVVMLPLCAAISHGLAMARLGVSVLHQGELHSALELDRLSGGAETVLTVVQESYVADNLEAGLLTSLLLWAALAVPPDLWRGWFEADGG